MAQMAVYLKSRPRLLLRASSPLHSSSSISHFSSNTSDETPQNTENTQTSPRNTFREVLSQLQGNPQQSQQPPPRSGFSFSQGARSARSPSAELDEIKKNLSEYTRRSVDTSGPSSYRGSQGQLSLQNLYKKRADMSYQNRDTSVKLGIDSIRKSFPANAQATDGSQRHSPMSAIANLKKSLNTKPTDGSNAAGLGPLPAHVFKNELNEKSKKVSDPNALWKDYSKDELGEKLRNLRPEGVKQGQNWFSVSELNERLIKLRELEQQIKPQGPFDELRMSMKSYMGPESANNMYTPRVGMLSFRGATTDYMLLPPKENLVEQYYHPDNMSSAEKLKLKLKSVRDEFKMSETDCGSTRVQIAQLTTEILHLSKVLHKKDKHSLKGLLAKVQLRKKLLKYLRRTDWDSYCFILSKLGLRDNPGYKQH